MNKWMEEWEEGNCAMENRSWNTFKDDDQELKELERAYIDITLAGYNLMGVITDKRKKVRRFSNSGMVCGACAKLENGYVKITVPRLPEKVEVWKYLGTQYAKSIHDYWQAGIRQALQELGGRESIINLFTQCSIIIRILKDSNRDWDVDNFHIKYIIDGIRYAGVIPDDAWYRLRYLVMGKDQKDKNLTEIYIMDSKDFVEIYSSLG